MYCKTHFESPHYLCHTSAVKEEETFGKSQNYNTPGSHFTITRVHLAFFVAQSTHLRRSTDHSFLPVFFPQTKFPPTNYRVHTWQTVSSYLLNFQNWALYPLLQSLKQLLVNDFWEAQNVWTPFLETCIGTLFGNGSITAELDLMISPSSLKSSLNSFLAFPFHPDTYKCKCHPY